MGDKKEENKIVQNVRFSTKNDFKYTFRTKKVHLEHAAGKTKIYVIYLNYNKSTKQNKMQGGK